MARLAWVVMGVAALVGATALAVSLGDRELFVPPPDAVAEGFVREVITGRYSRAQEYLSEPRPEKELRALRETLGHDPTEVEAEVISRTDEEALVNVRTTEAAVALALEFEGEWKIR